MRWNHTLDRLSGAMLLAVLIVAGGALPAPDALRYLAVAAISILAERLILRFWGRKGR